MMSIEFRNVFGRVCNGKARETAMQLFSNGQLDGEDRKKALELVEKIGYEFSRVA